jgi:hypothetical protein
MEEKDFLETYRKEEDALEVLITALTANGLLWFGL